MAANPSSLTIDRVCQWLAGLAPLALAEVKAHTPSNSTTYPGAPCLNHGGKITRN